MEDDHYKSFITVNFGPNWDNIAITRRYIDEMVYNEAKSKNAKNLSAAASELMENACKYSCYGGGFISIWIYQSSKNLKISVLNVTTEKNIKLLKKRIKEVEKCNTEEGFRDIILDAYKNDPRDSHLGLAKIRFECNADIHLTVLEKIPDYLIPGGKNEDLIKTFRDAKAIEVTIVSSLN